MLPLLSSQNASLDGRRRIGFGIALVSAAFFAAAAVAQTGNTGNRGARGVPSQSGTENSESGEGSSTTSNQGTERLSRVIEQMSSAAGVTILADSAVSSYRVTPLTAATTSANVGTQIKQLLTQLPSGAVSGEFYLPASTVNGKSAYTGDSLEAFVMAESRLFGPVGGQTTGTVEILGQKLSTSAASSVVTALNLEPIYLIGKPNGRQGGGVSNASGTGQQRSAASEQAQQLMNMTPAERDAALTQMLQENREVLSQVMQNVSPAEQQQLMQTVRSTMGTGGGYGRQYGAQRNGGGPGGPQ